MNLADISSNLINKPFLVKLSFSTPHQTGAYPEPDPVATSDSNRLPASIHKPNKTKGTPKKKLCSRVQNKSKTTSSRKHRKRAGASSKSTRSRRSSSGSRHTLWDNFCTKMAVVEVYNQLPGWGKLVKDWKATRADIMNSALLQSRENTIWDKTPEYFLLQQIIDIDKVARGSTRDIAEHFYNLKSFIERDRAAAGTEEEPKRMPQHSGIPKKIRACGNILLRAFNITKHEQDSVVLNKDDFEELGYVTRQTSRKPDGGWDCKYVTKSTGKEIANFFDFQRK